MTARPNPYRALIDAKRNADAQIAHLAEMVAQAQAVLATDAEELSAQERTAYRTCVMVGQNQLTKYEQLAKINVPLIEMFADSITHPANNNAPRARKTAAAVVDVKKPGRPKGSKNKPKEEVAVAEAAPRTRKSKPAVAVAVVSGVKKPGRPKGSKNKPRTPEQVAALQARREEKLLAAQKEARRVAREAKKLEKLKEEKRVARAAKKAEAAAPTASGKKPRKEKPLPMAALGTPVAATEKRGPGRPKGSKNRPKDIPAVNAPAMSDAPTKVAARKSSASAAPTPGQKRGPGRPKGSKNKPKHINGHNHDAAQQT